MHFSSPTARLEDDLYLPDGAGMLTRFRLALRALQVLAKQKDDSVAALLLHASMDGAVFARIVAELAGTADGAELLRARPNLQSGAVDLTMLHELPRGTLGCSLARHYLDNGIKPFESPYPIRNDVDYLAKRFRETHDLVHILTGYGTDPTGEMEVQAFVLGNLGLHTSLMILSFAALLRPDGLPPVWKYADRLRAAYRRGRGCTNIVRPRYERYWESSVEEVRRQLGIAALPRSPA